MNCCPFQGYPGMVERQTHQSKGSRLGVGDTPVCDPSTQEVEAGGSEGGGQPGLHTQFQVSLNS
jgi:hypothetical protein